MRTACALAADLVVGRLGAAALAPPPPTPPHTPNPWMAVVHGQLPCHPRGAADDAVRAAGRYLEIFARKNNLRDCWVSIGNEVTGTGLPEEDMRALQVRACMQARAAHIWEAWMERSAHAACNPPPLACRSPCSTPLHHVMHSRGWRMED